MADLSVEGVTKRFGDVTAVDNVSLDISSGEFVSLLGASGCGKTTLLRMIAGFVRSDAGVTRLAGECIDSLPPNKRGIGFVFQSYALFPTKTVRQNIAFALSLRRVPQAAIERRVRELCGTLQLDGLEARYPHELSGGQQQRVALARALAPEPGILLLDEPLSALDAKIRTRLRAEVRAVVERSCVTALYVTHDQEEALAISDRVAVMDAGRIVQIDRPILLYHAPQSRFVAEFVGETNILSVRSNGSRSIQVEGTSIQVPRPGGVSGGRRLAASIRPESLRLDGPKEQHFTDGTLCGMTFLGPMARLRVSIASGRELIVDTPSNRLPQADQGCSNAVRLYVDPGDIAIFPDD